MSCVNPMIIREREKLEFICEEKPPIKKNLILPNRPQIKNPTVSLPFCLK